MKREEAEMLIRFAIPRPVALRRFDRVPECFDRVVRELDGSGQLVRDEERERVGGKCDFHRRFGERGR